MSGCDCCGSADGVRGRMRPNEWVCRACGAVTTGRGTSIVAALLARAAAERAEADRLDAAADPIRAAMHYHCARVLEEVASAAVSQS